MAVLIVNSQVGAAEKPSGHQPTIKERRMSDRSQPTALSIVLVRKNASETLSKHFSQI
jgi:hypothetical protein